MDRAIETGVYITAPAGQKYLRPSGVRFRYWRVLAPSDSDIYASPLLAFTIGWIIFLVYFLLTASLYSSKTVDLVTTCNRFLLLLILSNMALI